jgi:competence protein ComEA
MENSLTLLLQNKKLTLSILIGLILIGLGIVYFKKLPSLGGTKVEVLNDTTKAQEVLQITVEIAGQVERPGVYKLPDNSRVEDLLISAGGFSKDADRVWTEKYLNRAAKLTDSQKVYIPKVGEQTLGASAKENGEYQTISSTISTPSSGLVNINTATLSQLDKLPGIGPTYGQSIIDHRPYSNVEELVSKGAIKQNVFAKIKDQVSVY